MVCDLPSYVYIYSAHMKEESSATSRRTVHDPISYLRED